MEIQENLAIESTTSQGQGTNESKGSDVSKGQALEDCSNATAEVDQGLTEALSQQPFLVIRHNHKDKGLSQAEAVTLAQKGMAYDSTFEAVVRAAALQGKSVKEFVNGFETQADEDYRKTLLEKFGDDVETVDDLMELYFVKKEGRVTDFLEKGNEAKDRLNNEFLEFKKHFPEVNSFDELPETVIEGAKSGKDILSEYLRYRFFESQKAEAAKQTALAASNASAGSAATAEQLETAETAFIKGLQMV